MKRMLKKSLENQSEIQSRFIEYNKIIGEQENIIHLNNLKLNEHDSKLTEILITFNNYLQLNDKTTKIVNDLTTKLEDSVKKSDFGDLKSTIYNFNRNNETKISESFNKLEELSMKTVEISKEQEVFQKYTLEKLKSFQNEYMENRISQQQQLIRLEESRENKMNQSFEQFKGMIKLVEKSIANEAAYRKNMIDNLNQEISQDMNKREEKISILEKTQLETEQKLINFNKDYITTFQELIIRHNQKYDIELKSVKSIFENGLFKFDTKLKEYMEDIENQITDAKNSQNQDSNAIVQLENYYKENFEALESKILIYNKETTLLKSQVEIISESFSNFIKENLKVMENKIDGQFNLLDMKYNKNLIDLSANQQNLEFKTEKSISDILEKLEILSKLTTDITLKNVSPTSDKNFNGMELGLLDRKLDDKIVKIKQEIEEFENKLINLLNSNIEKIKTNFELDSKSIVQNISDKLETKINLLKKEFETKRNEDTIMVDGRIQEYVIESEDRIKIYFEPRINKIQTDLENINIKFIGFTTNPNDTNQLNF